MNRQRTPARVLRGTADGNIRFDDPGVMLIGLRFVERTRGSRSIDKREGIEEILTLQPRGSLAKAYRVKQIRDVILRYKLAGGDDDE